jgi:hypothetical protein
MNDRSELGMRFWLTIVGVTLGAVTAGILVFMVIGHIWWTWGFFGACLAVAAAALGFGYVYDRRDRKRRGRLTA